MFTKLEDILKRYKELENLIADPDVVTNAPLYQNYAKEMARLRNIAVKFEEYKKAKADIAALEADVVKHEHEPDLVSMIKDEVKTLDEKVKRLDSEMEDALFEDDEDSQRNIIMEIRAGTGGIEAALFAGDLYRMYTKYASNMGWSAECLSTSLSEKNGIKEIIFSVSGNGVYGKMKYESGTHRVQRVPVTEASGRIHTSAATVAVLPEAEDVDIKINPQDLKIDVYRSGGAGGQHVNVTDSAVRITHLPTGVVVTCQDERSQFKNKEKAMRVLRTRLYEKAREDHNAKISKERKVQVGTGDRSEKIRTYNFPDGRVTDHRIGLTLYSLNDILNGEIEEIINALKEAERKLRRGET